MVNKFVLAHARVCFRQKAPIPDFDTRALAEEKSGHPWPER